MGSSRVRGRVRGHVLSLGTLQESQSREHLFKECTTWTKEIRELWSAVGEASGRREEAKDRYKSRKGFGYRVRQARARPRNTSIRGLLSDDRYTEAVLAFWEQRGWGRSKKEQFVNKRGRLPPRPPELRPGSEGAVA